MRAWIRGARSATLTLTLSQRERRLDGCQLIHTAPRSRFHRVQHAAIYWGLDPPRPFPFRFDAPNGEFGVLYAAADEHAAFIETFGHSTGFRRIGTNDLATRRLASIEVSRPLASWSERFLEMPGET